MTYEDLLIYAARLGEFDDIIFCIDEKVDPNTQDASGNTALRKPDFIIVHFVDMACANNYLEIVKYLIDHGANQNLANASKNTPLRMT